MVGFGDVKFAEGHAFDRTKFAEWLTGNAVPPYGNGKCAAHVRQALEAAGLPTTGHPVSAKDYGPLLRRLGFDPVSPMGYSPKQGDIAVFHGNSRSVHGHIQGFDGRSWTSDHVQKGMIPGPTYRAEATPYVVYRR